MKKVQGAQEDWNQDVGSNSRDQAIQDAEAIRATIGSLANGPVLSSRDLGAEKFVDNFFRASRLHFIGTWNERYASLLETLKPPPKLGNLSEDERCVLHVDMDAFFASVATREKPEYKDLPVAVCWGNNLNSAKSCEISCANYKARSFGVRAGQWSTEALRLCPDLLFFPFEFQKYSDTAIEMYKTLFQLTPHVMGLSCDEAFVDISHLVSSDDGGDTKANSIRRIAEALRDEIYKATKGCTVSIGAGSNRLLARIATEYAKPNGFHYIERSNCQEVLKQLSIKKLPTIGYQTAKILHERGIRTCEDLRRISLEKLKAEFGEKNGTRYYEFCRGIDQRPWNPTVERRTISAQISWAQGVRMDTENEVQEFLQELSAKAIKRLGAIKSESIGAKSITLKVWRSIENADPRKRKGHLGHGQCDILNRKANVPIPINEARLVYEQAYRLYKDLKVPVKRVRGFGIALSDFGKSYNLMKSGFSKKRAEKREIESSKAQKRSKLCDTRKHTKIAELSDLSEETSIKSLSFNEMENKIIKELRHAKYAPMLLPFLQNRDKCSEEFCLGKCTNRRCFEEYLVDSVADLLHKCCKELNSHRVELVRAVKAKAELMFEAHDQVNTHWQACCDQLLHEFKNAPYTHSDIR